MTPLEEAEKHSRLWHIADAAAKLVEITHRSTLDQYINDTEVRWAIDHGLTIIGEAAARLRRVDPQIAITGINEIVGFRNRLIHEYDAMDPAEVWSILMNDLPHLLAEVRALLPPT